MNQITAKCILGHTFAMTATDIERAKLTGCAMCPTCFNPATIVKVQVSIAPKKKKAAKK